MPKKERERCKTSKRIGCRTFAKLKKSMRDASVCVERVASEHNHPIARTLSLVTFIQSHKNFDPSLMQLVDTMLTSKVPRNAQMNVNSIRYAWRATEHTIHCSRPRKQVFTASRHSLYCYVPGELLDCFSTFLLHVYIYLLYLPTLTSQNLSFQKIFCVD